MGLTDDERREVARKLREIELSKGGYIAWWKIAKALELKQLDGWFGWEKFYPDSAKRLADLIEPSCDRDALLALADEMVNAASDALLPAGMLRHMMRSDARRIREACGEVEE